MSRTLFSTSVKSPKSFASASAASTAFWAACSNRTKNSLFLGRSDRRTGVLLWRHILRHPGPPREIPSDGRRGRLGEGERLVRVDRRSVSLDAFAVGATSGGTGDRERTFRWCHGCPFLSGRQGSERHG